MSILDQVHWTQKDESDFKRLEARRKAFSDLNVAPVEQFVLKKWPFSYKANEQNSKALVRWLLNNADRVRDLLKPIDSGVRAQNEHQEMGERS